MKLIELHILQSFPVSCLNRDDLGSPKTATFGGVTRARISSQCLKRAIREYAKEIQPSLFQGNRSRLIITPLVEQLKKNGLADAKAVELAKDVGDHLAAWDVAAEKKGEMKVKTLMFLSPLEIAGLGKILAEAVIKDPKVKTEKLIAAACKSAGFKDAADIAIFGRMVANDHSLTVEGAGMFSHALSTHKVDNDIDFFSAVDDLQSKDEAGAGMTGTLEFTSATYYRYASLNLNLLKQHLAALSADECKTVIRTFLEAAVMAVPGARKNSMNANTLPFYVLGIVKEKGQPIQLINAFEKPVYSREGIAGMSGSELKKHYDQLKKTWNIQTAVEVAIPDVDFETFCKELLKHVC